MSPAWKPLPELTSSRDSWRDTFFSLNTRLDLAELLEIEYRLLVHVIFGDRARYYSTFNIPKRTGGHRTINAPGGSLKILQAKLAGVLGEVYETKPPVQGFARGRGIVSNARRHYRSQYVLNIDLKDFFPTITFPRVMGMFQGKPYNRPREVAVALAAICCVDESLPQGAATSPVVSNMLCGQLDSQLLRLASRFGCTYTRYADDITISTRRRTFPTELASLANDADGSKTVVGHELQAVIDANGFVINPTKVRLQHRQHRQMVTGLVVNQSPNVQRRLVRQVRSMLHAAERFGLPEAQREFKEKYDHRAAQRRRPDTAFVDVLRGRISFIGMVRGTDDKLYLRLRGRLRLLAPLTGRRSRSAVSRIRDLTVFDARVPEWAGDDDAGGEAPDADT